MRFGQRLCIILILFALIPMLLIQQILMHFYEKHICLLYTSDAADE